MLGMEVGLIGLVAWVGGHTILLGGKRMDHTGFEASFDEGVFGRQVVIPSAFYHNDGIFDVVLLLSLTNLLDRHLEEWPLVLQGLRLDQHIPKVVGHHPLRAVLGRIDAHDREVLTTDLLNAGLMTLLGFCNDWYWRGFDFRLLRRLVRE